MTLSIMTGLYCIYQEQKKMDWQISCVRNFAAMARFFHLTLI